MKIKFLHHTKFIKKSHKNFIQKFTNLHKINYKHSKSSQNFLSRRSAQVNVTHISDEVRHRTEIYRAAVAHTYSIHISPPIYVYFFFLVNVCTQIILYTSYTTLKYAPDSVCMDVYNNILRLNCIIIFQSRMVSNKRTIIGLPHLSLFLYSILPTQTIHIPYTICYYFIFSRALETRQYCLCA